MMPIGMMPVGMMPSDQDDFDWLDSYAASAMEGGPRSDLLGATTAAGPGSRSAEESPSNVQEHESLRG
jgi:hypothetical protein